MPVPGRWRHDDAGRRGRARRRGGGGAMTLIGVVGLGRMGSRVARRLLDTGHEVIIWNRSAQRMTPLVERGAIPAASPADAATRARVLITLVADVPALRAV